MCRHKGRRSGRGTGGGGGGGRCAGDSCRGGVGGREVSHMLRVSRITSLQSPW